MHKVQPKTDNQQRYIDSIEKNIVTVCRGPAGSGKSLLAISEACNLLSKKKINKILISRTLVSCGEELGIFPGTLEEKIYPYFTPYIEYLKQFLGPDYQRLVGNETIEIKPLEILRGSTYHNTFMIIEESQNCTPRQLKMFLSRMGKGSKCVIVGDESQKDIKYFSGLEFCIEHLNGVRDCGMVKLGYEDILRNPYIGHILKIFDESMG